MSFDFVKEEFNKLPIEEQVDYINKKLKFQSLTKISEQIKIDRATIRKRFKKNGYILNKEKSIYEKSNQTNKSNPLNSVEKPIENNFDVNVLITDINTLKSQISTLNKKFNDLNNQINTNNTINTDSEIEIEVFEGEIVSRSYKIDKDVQQDFKVFCKSNSEFRVSDILSTALKQFLDRYKK